MAINGKTRAYDDEASLAARAAWLYFSAGMTQTEIAKRLNVPATKAHRLVARATRDGLIRVFVDAEVAECIDLEDRLASRYGLDMCRVAPDLGEEGLPLKALGQAGASVLKALVEKDDGGVIGIGNGRTLAAMVDQLPSLSASTMRFVSVLGGLTRKFAANPLDVIHRLAEKTQCDAFLMPVPIFANTREDKTVLVAQFGIADAFALARTASPIFAGIGELAPRGFLVGTGMIRPEEREELIAAKACGEILGHFFDNEGRVVETGLSARALSLEIGELKASRVIGIGGGPEKTTAMLAALRSGVLKGLITDEATARRVIDARRDRAADGRDTTGSLRRPAPSTWNTGGRP